MPPSRGASPAPGAISDAEWDAFLAECPFAHHEQSSTFGRNREGYGFTVERVATYAAGKLTGGAQILVQHTPLGKLATVQRGPIALGDNPAILSDVVRRLELHALEGGYRVLRIDLFPHQSVAMDALRDTGFASLRGIVGMQSVSVPLNHPEHELLHRMRSRVGRELRRATAKGVEIRTGRETLGDFYALYQKTSDHHGFPIFPLAYFEELWRTLGADGRLHSVVAYLDDRPLAGILNSIVGEEMYYGWGGMSREPADRSLRANFLLHWSAISEARRSGLHRYDFAGESPFKQWFAVESIAWTAPLWKFHGPAGRLYGRMLANRESGTLGDRVRRRLLRAITSQRRMPL